MYVDTKVEAAVYSRAVIEEDIAWLVELNDPSDECDIKILRDILDYFDEDGAEYASYFFEPLLYRIGDINNPNYLCTPSGQWARGDATDLYEASFKYFNSIYNIYAIDDWPTILPPPPIKKSNEISILKECSEEYVKQNKNKNECNRMCCGWPLSGYVCGEVDGLLGSEGSCVKEEKTNKKIRKYYY